MKFGNESGIEPSASLVAHELSSACDHYEAAWNAGSRPQLEHYLSGSSDVERSALFRALLTLELYFRRTSGEEPRPEEYIPRFPEHAEIIVREFKNRQQRQPIDV